MYKYLANILITVFCLLLISCHPVPGPDKTFTGAILGAGWGAGAGAVIGHQTGNAGPGAGLGSAFGAASGIMTGIGLDVAEGTELEQQRQLDALKVQVASSQRSLMMVQQNLDDRSRALQSTGITDRIFFDSDRASLRYGSAAQLQRLAETIKANPYIGRIELHGHTDDSGDQERNERLSEARARTIATFLTSQGISIDRLNVISHGSLRPLATNETEEGRQLNRRVEVLAIK